MNNDEDRGSGPLTANCPEPMAAARSRSGILKRRYALGALALACGLAVQAGAPPGANVTSLRLLTYNTGFMILTAPVFGEIDTNGCYVGVSHPMAGLCYDERAHAIAQHILSTDQDVVVINEAFSKTAKEVFVKELGPAYPNYIAELRDTAPKSLTIPCAAAAAPGLVPQLAVIPHAGALLTAIIAVQPECFLSAGLGSFDLKSNDSGLMIFLKKGLEFAPFSSKVKPPYGNALEVIGVNKGQDWGKPGELAAWTYTKDECSGLDCLASKAVALVRVRRGDSTEVFNVAFSHTQAWNDDEDVKMREIQFQRIKELILTSLTPQELKTQPLYLAGDLNVPGSNDADTPPGTEWTHLFGSTNNAADGFFACPGKGCTFDPATRTGETFLTDSWAYQTSPDDPGITNHEDQARLDYILHNAPGNLCLQHIMIAYDLGEPSIGLEYSDHLAVRADFNNWAHGCNVRDATAAVFGGVGSPQDWNYPGNLWWPGSMQWVRIDDPGAYSIAVTGANSDHIGFDVYQKTDLSRPIGTFEGEQTEWGMQYDLPDPPYFIRTFAKNPGTVIPDRHFKGPYTLRVHQHRGLSALDALPLPAGALRKYVWPGPTSASPFPADQVIWHKFFTGTDSAGRYPEVRFFEQTQEMDMLDMGLTTGAAAPAIPMKDETGDWNHDGYKDRVWTPPGLDGQFPPAFGAVLPFGGQPRRYYLTMQRDSWMHGVQMPVTLRFETSLTYYRPISMVCLNRESADWGTEFMVALSSFEHKVYRTSNICAPGPQSPGCAVFDARDDSAPNLWQLTPLQGSFADNMVPNLWTWPSYEYLDINYTSAAPPDPTIGGYSPWESGVHVYGANIWGGFVWSDAGNPDDAHYWYQMNYMESHSWWDVAHAKYPPAVWKP